MVEPIAPEPAPPLSRATIIGVCLFVGALAILLIFFVPDAEPKIEPDVTDARVLYQNSCAICHGPAGQGQGVFKKIAGTPLSLQEIDSMIENGKGTMPAFRNFSPEQRAALSKYVKEMKP